LSCLIVSRPVSSNINDNNECNITAPSGELIYYESLVLTKESSLIRALCQILRISPTDHLSFLIVGYLLCKLALNSQLLDFVSSADPSVRTDLDFSVHGLDAKMPEELGTTSLW
jgi:hypothetical protein